MKKQLLYIAIIMGIFSLLLSNRLSAVQVNAIWIGGTNNWNTAANWSPAVIPNNGTPSGTTYNVLIDNGSGTASVVTLNTSATVDKLTLDSNDALQISNSRLLTIVAGVNAGLLTNQGTITVNGAASATGLRVSGGDVTFTGSGQLVLAGTTNSRITGVAASDRLIHEASHTIRGLGQIGINTMALTNRGTINANIAASTLTIDPSASGAVNSGTMKATSGGILVLTGGVFNNFEGLTDGLIRSDASTVRITSSTVTGGAIDVIGAGTIELNASTVQSTFTNSTTGTVVNTGGASVLGGTFNNPLGGLLQVNSNTTLSLENTGVYNNAGTIRLLNTSGTTTLRVGGGDVTLSGGGILDLATGTIVVRGVVATDRLINQNNTIQGRGQLGNNLMGFVNQGTVNANLSGISMIVNPSASNATNTGTMRASGGGILQLTDGTFTNTGGLIEALTGSRVEFNTNAVITGGTLASSGTGELRIIGDSTYNSITNTGAMTILSSGVDATFTGTNTNNGTLTASNSTGTTSVFASGGDVLFTGTGVLNGANSGGTSRILGVTATDRLINDTAHTIRGRWQIGANAGGLVNHGLVDADINAAIMTVDPSTASSVTNDGTMRASNGGILQLTGGTYANTGGTVSALTGSRVELSGANLTGGTLTSSGTGELRLTGDSTFNSITNTGAMTIITSGVDGTFTGTNTNNGTLTVSNTTGTVNVQVSGGDVTFTGNGALNAINIAGRIVGIAATDRFVNDTNHTIHGKWQIGVNAGGLVNHGLVDSDIAAGITTLDPSTSSSITNDGVMRASNGGILQLTSGNYTNTGGTVSALTGSRVEFNGSNLTGGTLTSSGTGELRLTGDSTFNSITNTGAMTIITSGVDATFTGTNVNNGTITMDHPTGTTDIRVSGGNVTFNGTGSIQLNTTNNNRIIGALATDRFINGASHTIQGRGQIISLLTNNGTVDANTGSGIILSLDTNAKINNGLFRASNAAILDVNTPVSGTGRWEAASGGKLQIDAVVTTTGNIDVLGSELEINANMSGHNLHMEPSGILDVNGTSQLTLSGSLSFAMTNEAQWDWTATSDLIMTGGVGQTTATFINWGSLEVGGTDLGTNAVTHVGAPAGFSNNFDLSELIIGAGAHVYLADFFNNGNRGGPFGTPEALYVDTLRFADTTGQLNLNGLHLYYGTLIGNISQIIDVPVPADEPSSIILLLMPGFWFMLRNLRNTKSN